MNDSQRLTNLEGTIAFQERTIDDLNEVVTRQQVQIDRLEQQLKLVLEQLNAAGTLVRDADQEEPPPHY